MVAQGSEGRQAENRTQGGNQVAPFSTGKPLSISHPHCAHPAPVPVSSWQSSLLSEFPAAKMRPARPL